MERTIAVNNRSLPLIIRRTGRKRSIGVELTCRHEVIVRVPRAMGEGAIREGLGRCLPWLRKKLAALPPPPPLFALGAGGEVLLLGERKRVVVEAADAAGCRVASQGEVIRVVVAATPAAEREAAVRAALAGWYREAAAGVIGGLVTRYSALLGVRPPPFSISQARRRWGSCGVGGRLHFAWRLIMAPPELIEYVVVHELCHLKRRDHSPAFWARVAEVLPDYRERRRRLREEGLRYDL